MQCWHIQITYFTTDIVFDHNDKEYLRFNATDDELQFSQDIDVGSSTLICNPFDSGLNDVVFNLNSIMNFYDSN